MIKNKKLVGKQGAKPATGDISRTAVPLITRTYKVPYGSQPIMFHVAADLDNQNGIMTCPTTNNLYDFSSGMSYSSLIAIKSEQNKLTC